MHTGRRRFLQMSAAAATLPVVPACSSHDRSVVTAVPANSFGADSTAEEVTEGIDLVGKIAVVTGCTSGIGHETMRVLALRGAWVLGTSRSLERAEAACKGVRGRTSPLQLDLSDFDSVVRCAETIRGMNSPIDILVLNAGYRGGGNERQLVDGVEKHFRINHLGHFLLVNRLLDRLYFAWQGRIVVVSSRWAYMGAPEEGILFDDLQMARRYSDSKAYGHSKLANALFSLELGKLLRGSRITSNALHPGVINTNINRNMSSFGQAAFGLLAAVAGKTIEQGAATSCYVATGPSLGATSGRYFEDCTAVEVTNSHLQDMTMADRLWLLSEDMTRDYLVTHDVSDRRGFENGTRRRAGESS